MAETRQELRQTNQRLRRRLLKRRLGVLLILVVLLLVGLVFFLRLERWQLQEITIHGNLVTSGEELERVIEDQISGSYFYVLPRRQRWFYPGQSIRTELLKQFPRLQSVLTHVRNGQLSIVVKEYSPAAVWCPSGEFEQCYFVNARAQVFSAAPQFSRPIYLTIETASARLVNPGPAPFSASDLKKLLVFQSNLQTILNHYWPQSVGVSLVKLKAGDYSFVVHSTDSDGRTRRFSLLINLERSSDDTLNTLELFLSSDSLIKELTDQSLTLDYLDLRFAPKVFYRFLD